jgi:hypothetical protein
MCFSSHHGGLPAHAQGTRFAHFGDTHIIMNLQILPPAAHAAMDHALGAMALAAPRLLGFDHYAAPTMLSRGIGIYALASALFTRNDGGLIKALPFKTHLKMDAASNVLALASPWLFGFASNRAARRTILTLAILQGVVWLLTRRDRS